MGDPLGCTWMGRGFREENVRPCRWTMMLTGALRVRHIIKGKKSLLGCNPEGHRHPRGRFRTAEVLEVLAQDRSPSQGLEELGD